MKTIYKKNKNKLTTPTFNIIRLLFLCILLITTSCKDNNESCGYDDACGGSTSNPKVDLIILIDTSGSMSTVASSISAEATSAISEALGVCNSDLRVEYLGVDGTWSSTSFTTSHRNYLTTLHGIGVTLAADQNHVGLLQEQGANAIEDLSNLYDWRDNACRVIFYVSDEELDSVSPPSDFTNENAATANAIAGATGNNVAVFAHYLTYQNRAPSILTNYTDLTSQTGGQLFTTNSNPLPANYYKDNNIFDDIICNACNGCE